MTWQPSKDSNKSENIYSSLLVYFCHCGMLYFIRHSMSAVGTLCRPVRGRLKMRDMKIRDGQKCRTWKCETWKCGTMLQGWKMRDMKMRDQIAGVENAGKVSMESQSVKKCLKVVVLSVVLSIVLHWLYIGGTSTSVLGHFGPQSLRSFFEDRTDRGPKWLKTDLVESLRSLGPNCTSEGPICTS